MGNDASKPAGHHTLFWSLPPLHNHGLGNESGLDPDTKIWADNNDREQFIVAVSAVASRNGAVNFSDHHCKLIYARRQKTQSANGKQYKTNEGEMIATLVFMKNGIIEAKIEPTLGGKDKKSAFLAFRRDVEEQLNKLLQSVPGGGGAGQTEGERNTSNTEASGPSTASTEAPPAYEPGQNTGPSKA
ncbi:MAG: hypothetical protein Q9160_001614 [Pyrenula sp. 1 TL-2023]